MSKHQNLFCCLIYCYFTENRIAPKRLKLFILILNCFHAQAKILIKNWILKNVCRLDQNHLHITPPPSKVIEKPWYKSTSGLLHILRWNKGSVLHKQCRDIQIET